jgi:hypothetical protein
MGEGRGAYRVWWGNPREKHLLDDLGIDVKIILKLVIKK